MHGTAWAFIIVSPMSKGHGPPAPDYAQIIAFRNILFHGIAEPPKRHERSNRRAG